ncbi:FUN34 transmembrane protein [Macrolepiota fuliginosa MF-IS2]|uniref:FUN34 transmembrane protein n=1 Tax=Macrolepiota fuliginosa MF-IS2 TaxID=1400762 RepID=A0A9P5XAN2_9AGAR|nr:FUN34 transmembrane protein [Macrolepiota fuliginosa MF-IS2]
MEKGGSGHTVEYVPEHRKEGRRRMANPGPMGLFSFAATTFLLSLFNLHTRDIQTPNVIIGMAIFAGGLVQLLAGMWEVPNGNVFGATAFASYGAFWMSYATIFIPSSGVIASFNGNMDEFNQAIGLYLMVWFMITLMFIPPVLKKNIAFVVLLSCLSLALLMLSIGAFNGMPSVNKAGGVFGVITGLVAFYIGVAQMLAAERTAIIHLPLGVLSED